MQERINKGIAHVLSVAPCFFQSIEQIHELIDFCDDAVLFGKGR